METLDNDFDTIATNGKNCTKIEMTHKYKKHRSNDRTYFLSNVKVI
ncbi:hypothetical protein [Caminicella sporogenes]|nr:hypothetical protein [Caminicella sporogenes]